MAREIEGLSGSYESASKDAMQRMCDLSPDFDSSSAKKKFCLVVDPKVQSDLCVL